MCKQVQENYAGWRMDKIYVKLYLKSYVLLIYHRYRYTLQRTKYVQIIAHVKATISVSEKTC